MHCEDSVTTIFVCAVLVLSIVIVDVNTSGLCNTDNDCTDANTFCDDGGVCMCTAGHTNLNGACSPVFGRTCLDDLNCDDGRSFCKDSKCVCNTYEWKEDNGVCVGYYGSFCIDWSDCGPSNNYVCEDNRCTCGADYKLKDGSCVKIINSRCRIDSSTEDCPLEHAVCKRHYWIWEDMYGECKCENGFDEHNGICLQGSSCEYVGCGNTLHYSYRYLDPSFKPPNENFDYMYFYGSSSYWFDWYYYYHLHLTCNIDNLCVCDHGFKPDASEIFCEPVLGTHCESSDDCGTYHGYICDSDLNQCTCAENYIHYSQEWRHEANVDETYQHIYNYYPDQQNVYLCKPELGQSCSIVSCTFENAYCNERGTCSCEEGYTENNDGTCQQVLGMSCIRETLCQIVAGGFCADDNTCKCKEGFVQTGCLCQAVLDSTCTSNSDCQLDHTVCIAGTCECEPTKYGERCLRPDCSDVPELPDIRRRSVLYTPVEGEPLIDDTQLKEGWYSIGKHSLYGRTDSLESGSCATFYPICLTEPLTTSQLDTMAAGEDITVAAEVRNLDLYGHVEQVSLKLRKCGQDTHVYVITPLLTHFSGLCLENEHIPDITRSTGIKATVLTDLLFSSEILDTVTKHTPYIVFSCVASEFIITTTYQRYPYEGYVTEDDIYFYYVHWYIDNVHFRSIGPLSRYSFINGSSIFEMDIIEAGYKLGFGIRCTFEISEVPNGQNSLLAISEEIYTGFQPLHVSVPENADSYFLQLKSSSPLGCETTEGNGDETCNLFWPVLEENEDALCNQPVTGNEPHELCNVFVRGYSYGKYNNSWGSWSYLSQWEANWNYHYDYNYTETDDVRWNFNNHTTELFGVYIDLLSIEQAGLMTIKFRPTESTTGHMIWNSYKMPDINVNVVRSSFVQETCKLSVANVPILTKETDWTHAFSTENVEIDQVGEFTMYRSTKKPVNVQIQTEACNSTTSGVCLCAVNYRDGDNTYIYSYCGGLTRIGQTNGELTHRLINNVQLINGIALRMETWNNKIVNVSLNTSHSDSTLEDGEGLCMFAPGSYKHRDGTEETDSYGFVSSWGLPVNESLLSPLNHKAVSWVDEYTQCGCPDNTEILQEREQLYHWNHTNRYNHSSYLYIDEWYQSEYKVHLGYIRCSAEKTCTINHSGDGEWSGSLLPVFSLTNIEARMKILYKENWPCLHLFCDFKRQEGYKYTITWKVDDDIVYTSRLLDYSSLEQFNITNDDLSTNKFLLEVKFSCGVSIHDESDVELLSSQYSEEISAVEFVKHELLLPRGGDVIVQIRLNIPFVCTLGHQCSFDIKLFALDDANNCSDSSIVIKGQQTCGKRIHGTFTEEELVNEARIVNITVTTTNNGKYVLKDTFHLKMKLTAYGDTSTFWLHTFTQVLTVFVRDDENYWQRNYCYANNDPRMRTFDGQYFNNMMAGVLVMMRHTRFPVEIQLETTYCGGWRVACACAVTIRAGRDVFTVNHCHGDHVTGYLLADDRILKIRKRSAHRYEIYLPHGTRVDVRISSWNGFMVNVFIYPSPADMKKVEGLCGNFNGNWKDDLIHSDGIVTASSQYYWSWYDPDPEDFVQSWGLIFTNGLDLTDVEEIDAALHSWYENDVFCVCTGNDGNGEIRCSANEEDTCLTHPVKQGEDLSITARNKRSVVSPYDGNKHRLAKMREKRAAISNPGTRTVRRNALSIEDAIELCRETLSNDCGIITAPSDGVNVTFEELVNNCGQDTVDNPGIDWIGPTCAAMEANVEIEVGKDNKLQKENPALVSKIMEMCVGNCSGQGQCVEGKCNCFDGYGEDDCSIPLSYVRIERASEDGVCNKKISDCSCIWLTTTGSLATSVYIAVHYEAKFDGSWEEIETFQDQVDYRNSYEVRFCLEDKRRRKRSTSGDNIHMADQYVISLSNDGSTFGSNSTVYVLDSTCLQTNGTDNIVLITGYCIIDGDCYATNTPNPSDSCMLCKDSANPFGWTKNNDKDECSESEAGAASEDTDDTKLALLIAVPLSTAILIAILVAVIVIIKKPSQRVESTSDTGGNLYDMPKNVRFHLRKEEAWTY